MQSLQEKLTDVKIGPPMTFENLTLFPLLGASLSDQDYLTLDDALAQGVARITEMDASGSVPQLQFVNEGSMPVLLMDGEELIGAKQNRIINISILAPAQQTLTIPVSCVEAGRWSSRSAEFAAAPRAQYAEGRARKMSRVSESMHASGTHYSNQSEVWEDISLKSARMAAHSETQAMAAMYETHDTDIEEYVNAFSPSEGQVGALFAINGMPVGFDLFDSSDTFDKLLPKLIRSYALDALDRKDEEAIPLSVGAAEGLLQEVQRSPVQTYKALGLGEDARFSDEALTGGGLLANGRLVHLTALALSRTSNVRPQPAEVFAIRIAEPEDTQRSPSRTVGREVPDYPNDPIHIKLDMPASEIRSEDSF